MEVRGVEPLASAVRRHRPEFPATPGWRRKQAPTCAFTLSPVLGSSCSFPFNRGAAAGQMRGGGHPSLISAQAGQRSDSCPQAVNFSSSPRWGTPRVAGQSESRLSGYPVASKLIAVTMSAARDHEVIASPSPQAPDGRRRQVPSANRRRVRSAHDRESYQRVTQVSTRRSPI